MNKKIFVAITVIFLIPSLANASPPILTGEILFRNSIILKDGRNSSGASAFLLNYEGNDYAVTAKHMLNHMMGFDPPILPTNFDQKIQSWKLKSIIGDNELTIRGIVHPDDDWENDILLLNVQPQDTHLKQLRVSKKKPLEGECLYIVGCPYDEVSCKQNIYKIVFVKRKHDTIIFDWPDKKISSRGFSGAPILNKDGNVVAVYTGYYVEKDKKIYQGQSVGSELKRIQSN